jgi:hypothetical protein
VWQLYINPLWSGRASQLNLKLYDTLPPGPITLASFANPAASRLRLNMADAANRDFAVCHLAVDPATPASDDQETILQPADAAPTCPAAPSLQCCTRVFPDGRRSLRYTFAAEAGLASISFWNRTAAATSASADNTGGAVDWGTEWAGFGVDWYSGDTRANCLLRDAADPNAVPGFRSRALVCGGRGRRLILTVPAGSGPLAVQMCIDTAASGRVPATVSLRQ